MSSIIITVTTSLIKVLLSFIKYEIFHTYLFIDVLHLSKKSYIIYSLIFRLFFSTHKYDVKRQYLHADFYIMQLVD